jgi:hypothetical protein
VTSAHPPGLYGRLALAVLKNRTATLVVLSLVTLLAAVFVVRLRVDSDIVSLMPANEPSTEALKRLDKEEGGINLLTIVVEGRTQEQRDAWLEAVGTELRALPEVDYVLWKVDPELTFRLGLLQIPTADLTTMRDRLQAAVALGPATANPFIAARLLDLGPLTERLETAQAPVQLGGDGKMGRMVVRPKGSAHDIPFSRVFMAKVDDILARSGAMMPEPPEDPSSWRRVAKPFLIAFGAEEPPPPAAEGDAGVTIRWIGGAYRHNVEDYENIVRDIGWITAAAFVMVLAIIAAAFRQPRSIVVIFVPLILSNLWTLGVAGATVGALNSFTSFVNAVLIGLGVEFGVHLLSRYREQRAAGRRVEDAIVHAWDLVGSACTSAAFTSAAGFAALIAAHFAGFRQLGWLLSLGLLLCLVAELVCMPLLLAWLERDDATGEAAAHKHRHRARRRGSPASYRMAPSAMLVLGCVTLVAALFIPRIQFEYDLSELRRAGLAYADLSEDEKALARQSYSPMVVSYNSQAELDEAYERVHTRVKDGDFPEIASVLSIRTVIPKDQDEKLALLKEIVALGRDPNASYLPLQVRENLAKIDPLPLTPVTPADLPQAVAHVLGAANGTFRMLLFPSGNMWDMREAAQLAVAVERELPGQEIAGEYLTLGVLYKLLQRDGPIIGAIAFALVVFFTFADLRSFRATSGAIAVLLSGVAWWAALLVGSTIKISIVSFVGIPIVLGIGIDVMIHLIHRMNQEGPGRIQKVLSTTGWASALGTSTTVVAFAALSLASSQGIRSLGLLVLLGEMSVTIAGFVLVPLGFATAWRLTGRHPGGPKHLPREDTNA